MEQSRMSSRQFGVLPLRHPLTVVFIAGFIFLCVLAYWGAGRTNCDIYHNGEIAHRDISRLYMDEYENTVEVYTEGGYFTYPIMNSSMECNWN